jgi:type IV secretion system protein VirD4
MSDKFDPLGELSRSFKQAASAYKTGTALSRRLQASSVRRTIEAGHGAEVADQVEQAILAGRGYEHILQRAQKDALAQLEREELLRKPPPLYGSAGWATPQEVRPFLQGEPGAERPGSIMLGAYPSRSEPGATPRQIHWNGDGHLMTLAPTRSGKARTMIVPNLLRYRGSAVVLDPKGELYAATSRWRRDNVGPVYRIAPFDTGKLQSTADFPRSGYDPLRHVEMDADLLALARLLFPRDPRSPEFFNDDAAVFMKGIMALVREKFPPAKANLASVVDVLFQPNEWVLGFVRDVMRGSGCQPAEFAAEALLGKRKDRGGPEVLLETLRTKLGTCWNDRQISESLRQGDVDFARLKDEPATVYIEIPFRYMTPFAPWLRIVIKSALDAMTINPVVPEIPVLFILDEFLQLQSFPEAVEASRTLAGSGVRLWYFLQDLAGLEKYYPDDWRALTGCAVRQYFGIKDDSDAEFVSRSLDTATVAYRSVSTSGNVSVQQGSSRWEAGSASASRNSSESIDFIGRRLLTPGEVKDRLSGWKVDREWRECILNLQELGSRPVRCDLDDYSTTEVWPRLTGAFSLPRRP